MDELNISDFFGFFDGFLSLYIIVLKLGKTRVNLQETWRKQWTNHRSLGYGESTQLGIILCYIHGSSYTLKKQEKGNVKKKKRIVIEFYRLLTLMPFSADLAQRIRFVKQTWSVRRNKPTKGITQRNKPIQHLLGLQLLFKLFYGEFQLQKLHFGSQKNKQGRKQLCINQTVQQL